MVAGEPAFDPDILSGREREILKWIVAGKTQGEIATILNITERTVSAHAERASAKLGVARGMHGAIMAAMNGLVLPPVA